MRKAVMCMRIFALFVMVIGVTGCHSLTSKEKIISDSRQECSVIKIVFDAKEQKTVFFMKGIRVANDIASLSHFCKFYFKNRTKKVDIISENKLTSEFTSRVYRCFKQNGVIINKFTVPVSCFPPGRIDITHEFTGQ
jgi:hypothetical protein